MSTPSLEPSGIPTLRTATAHFLMPPATDPTPAGVDAFVPAVARDHQPEILRIAAFCALWTFAATGCLLPWGGEGWPMVARALALLAVWIPLWSLTLILIFVLPGAFFLFLQRRDFLTARQTTALCTALAILFFSFIALLLARSPLLPCQIVGWIWIIALLVEVLLSIVLLFVKKRT